MKILPYMPKLPRSGAASVPDSEDKLPFTISDEIFCNSTTSSNKDKVVCLQKIEFEHDGHSELRLCFYIYDGAKWKFHRAAPMLSVEDLQTIVHEAAKKRWIAG